MNKSILLAEDDPNLGFVIKDNLEMKGYQVTLCTDGATAEQTFFAQPFDLCILDVMLPVKDGFAVAQSIRESDHRTPILFVTAKSMLEDKIAAFQLGGDDYLTKPFSMEELLCRMEVFLRRSAPATSGEEMIAVGDFEFDCRNLILRHPSSTKNLTQKEADLLKLLCENKDHILKREEILLKIWGDDDYFMGRSMDVFISKLRKYLKEDERIQIVNYHGVGFRLEQRTEIAQ